MKRMSLTESLQNRKLSLTLVVAVLMIVAILTLRPETAVYAVEGSTPVGAELGQLTVADGFAEVVETVSPAVVSISVTQKMPASRSRQFGHNLPQWESLPPWFRDMFPDFPQDEMPRRSPRRFSGVGAGVVFDPSGLIVTNFHVIEHAAEINVTLHDGTKKQATVVGIDQLTDLAVLQIDINSDTPYAEFGNSENVRVGDWALAIGDPFGLSKSVSLGIVSAMGRDLREGSPQVPLMQVDAAVNRGNSGGPLFNTSGQVIGINTMIISPTGASAGVGFAVPSSVVSDIVAAIRSEGKVTRGWLGVMIQDVTPHIAEALGVDAEMSGALVSSVEPGSPAERAGIEIGDVIVTFDGNHVDNTRALSRIVKRTAPGSYVSIVVIRDGDDLVLNGVLDRLAMAENEQSFMVSEVPPDTSRSIGAAIANLSDEMRQKYQIDESVEGVVILEVKPGSSAEQAGLEEGDVIVSINKKPVTSTRQASKSLREIVESGDSRALLLISDNEGTAVFIAVALS